MQHRGEAGEPGEVELLVAQTHHHRDLDGLAVWGAEIDAFVAAAEEQKRALDLLRVAMQSVGKATPSPTAVGRTFSRSRSAPRNHVGSRTRPSWCAC